LSAQTLVGQIVLLNKWQENVRGLVFVGHTSHNSCHGQDRGLHDPD